MGIRSWLYRLGRIMGDVNAIKRGRVGTGGRGNDGQGLMAAV